MIERNKAQEMRDMQERNREKVKTIAGRLSAAESRAEEKRAKILERLRRKEQRGEMLKAARREREKARMAMATERIVTQFLAEEMATHAQITKRIRPLTAPN